MSEPDDPLVRWIANRLHYRPLPQLIGRVCQVISLRTANKDIAACLSDVLPDLGSPIENDPAWMKQTLGQYKALDLMFEVPDRWLEEDYEMGRDLLDRLGFIMDATEAQQFEAVASLIGDNFDDPTLLGELQADLQEGHTVARLLLRLPEQSTPGTFPAEFIVADACITNAASVWLHRYPYF